MSTTCATIYARARAFTPDAPVVHPETPEILARIASDQQALFTSVAALSRTRFTTTASVTSTSAASGRTIALAALSPSVERVLKLTLADGREVSQVDELDTDAELAPRYYVRGTSLIEVGNDWNTASSAAVTATLLYGYGPTAISTTGAMSQAVSVPDEWCDLLVLPLVGYLAAKDPNPKADRIAEWAAMRDEREQQFLAYLTNYGGVESRRFDLPTPTRTSDKA